jgi:LAS superfamily LD-carboxypeptidase LdcB
MRTRLPVILTALVVLVSLVVGPSSATARRAEDPKAERERVRAQQAEVASNLNVLKTDHAQLEEALRVLQENVTAQENLQREADNAALAAEQERAEADESVVKAEGEVSELKDDIAEYAVDAYMMPNDTEIDTMFGSNNLNEAVQREAIIERQAGNDADLVDRLNAKQDELSEMRDAARDAEADAKAKQQEAAERVEKVTAARDQQAEFEQKVAARIDEQIAESIRLGEKDKELSYKIALEQAALEARLAEQRERDRKAAADAQAAKNRRSGGGGGGGGPAPVAPAGSSGGISLSTVGGITVSSQIAGQLKAMLDAASASGVPLSGGGYRNPAQQIAVRKNNCGTSYYAIYQMPASQCSPPTAPPGTSMHEVGLAIDFNNCGSRSTACYQWLNGNAGRFGFYNLPSESWHWSVNGN